MYDVYHVDSWPSVYSQPHKHLREHDRCTELRYHNGRNGTWVTKDEMPLDVPGKNGTQLTMDEMPFDVPGKNGT